jgi:DNA-binding XRE family transcriptional regulator
MEVIINGTRYVPARKVMPLSISLGQLIKTARNRHQWTLETLAQAAGLSRSTVWELEADRHAPSFGVAVRLAAVLGIALDDMAATIPFSSQLAMSAIAAKEPK